MFQTSRGNGALVALLGRHVRDPATNSLAVSVYERLPNATDFTPAAERGVAGYNFAALGRAHLYHSPLATPGAVDPATLQHMGAQALDLTRALLRLRSLPRPAPDVVFSDVLGLGVVSYAPRVGWLVLAAAAALLAVAAWSRRGAWTALGVVGAVGDALAAVVFAAGLLTAVNALSAGGGRTEYYDRLAALPRLQLQAVLILLAVLVAVAAGPRRAPIDRQLGYGALTLLAAAAVQWALPGAAPFFAWPLLAAVVAGAAAARAADPDGLVALGLAAAAAVVGLAFLGGLAHFALLAIGGTTPAAVAPLLLPPSRCSRRCSRPRRAGPRWRRASCSCSRPPASRPGSGWIRSPPRCRSTPRCADATSRAA
jgi:hypothetical protein